MTRLIQTSVIWVALIMLLVANYMFYGDVMLAVLILALAFLAGKTAKGW